jgi:hypothetical protein
MYAFIAYNRKLGRSSAALQAILPGVFNRVRIAPPLINLKHMFATDKIIA